MTPKEIKQARIDMGLSVNQMARLLETDPQTVRRIEMNPLRSTSRQPYPRMVRLINAYLDGFTPDDWPKGVK